MYRAVLVNVCQFLKNQLRVCKSACFFGFKYYKWLHCCIGRESRYNMWHVLSWQTANTIQWSYACMHLHANWLYSCSIPPYYMKEFIQKLSCFYDDHRNNVLLWLKIRFMTFKSQNVCIIHYSHFPPSHPTIGYYPFCKTDIDLAFKNLSWHAVNIIYNNTSMKNAIC